MTSINKHSLISAISAITAIRSYGSSLCTALILCACCTLGSCTNDSDPLAGESSQSRQPLTIRVSASSFTSLLQEGTPSTRTTEDGYETKFTGGEEIGVFAITNLGNPTAAYADNINNLKLVCSVDPTTQKVTWAPEDPNKILYNYNDLTYIAYYPYKQGITISISGSATSTAILQQLAANPKLQPLSNQSTEANYKASDLMTAVATPAAGSGDVGKIVTLNFEHQHALLLLNPRALINCLPPVGATFEYAGGVLVLDATAKDATINGIKALRMGDGTFRAIIPSPSGALVPSGSYNTKGDQTISFMGTSLAAGTLTAGKYYTLQVEAAVYTDGSMTRALQVGDYICSNGKVMPGETSIITEDYIGLVFKVGRFSGDDSNYFNGKGEAMSTINGYAVALKDANGGAAAAWGRLFTLLSNQTGSCPFGFFDGYKITQLLKADGISYYPAANACLSYTPVADAKTSGWFFPAGGQLLELRNTRTELIKKSIFTDYNSGKYWQSAQNGSGDSWSVGLIGTHCGPSYKSTPYFVRAILAF